MPFICFAYITNHICIYIHEERLMKTHTHDYMDVHYYCYKFCVWYYYCSISSQIYAYIHTHTHTHMCLSSIQFLLKHISTFVLIFCAYTTKRNWEIICLPLIKALTLDYDYSYVDNTELMRAKQHNYTNTHTCALLFMNIFHILLRLHGGELNAK